MLDVLNGYGHGFVATATILACRETGVFDELVRCGKLDGESLAEKISGNSGHLAAALRLLHSLGWVDRDDAGNYSLCVDENRYREIPSDVLQWWQFPLNEYLSRSQDVGELRHWIDQIEARWQVSDRDTAALLDGVIAVPLLTSLDELNWLRAGAGEPPSFYAETEGRVGEELTAIFVALGWATNESGSLVMTDLGGFVSERALILGTLGSYKSMLSQMPTLLTGDASSVFQRDQLGHEQHVERTLNVVGSGFQHEKYFADVEEIIVSIFDQPAGQQPDYIADMGCGDGTFLKRVHAVIANRTTRGRTLREHPVCLIGADFNEKALQATEANLVDIPHRVIRGDIGDPAQLTTDLSRSGIADPDSVLHIRSFLDHDRPLIEPQDRAALERRSRLPYQGVYVDSAGKAIEPSRVVQSLVEHLGRWASVASRHGLVVLEVHSVEPRVTQRFLDQSESLHFDAYHAYSMQYLVDADVFMMCAAEVGLFSKHDFFRRYPKTLPFCRITLSWLEPRPYTIRHADPDDLDAILEIRDSSTADIATTDEVIGSCIQQDPLSTYVVEKEGRIVAAAICLRTREKDASLYDPAGEVMQIKGLLVQSNDEAVRAPLLQFVSQHSLLKAGVSELADATTSDAGQTDDTDPVAAQEPITDIGALVDDTVQCLMEGNGESFSSEKTFYELGLDSLDHMELATTLAKSLGAEVDSSLLFAHDTPDKLRAFLQKREGKKSKTGSLFSLLKRSNS